MDRPVELAVERLRDGRRFSHRRVQVRAEGQLVCELMASFAAGGAGFEAQDVILDPTTPAARVAADRAGHRARRRLEAGRARARSAARSSGAGWDRHHGVSDRRERSSRYGAWVRPRFPLPAERAWHAAALAFLADYHSHMSVARWLGSFREPRFYTSLDQSLWLHRDLAWDDWWHLTTEGVVAHAGRALTRRSLHARDGRLVATMAQEQLIPAAVTGPHGA